MTQFSVNTHRFDPYKNFKFRVKWDGKVIAGVARLREICRVREVLLDFLVGPNQYGSTEVTLQRYFDAFAVAAAKPR